MSTFAAQAAAAAGLEAAAQAQAARISAAAEARRAEAARAARAAHRRYLSVVEYAELTGRKPDTIRKQCERGQLKTRAKRPGRHWAILATQAKP